MEVRALLLLIHCQGCVQVGVAMFAAAYLLLVFRWVGIVFWDHLLVVVVLAFVPAVVLFISVFEQECVDVHLFHLADQVAVICLELLDLLPVILGPGLLRVNSLHRWRTLPDIRCLRPLSDLLWFCWNQFSLLISMLCYLFSDMRSIQWYSLHLMKVLRPLINIIQIFQMLRFLLRLQINPLNWKAVLFFHPGIQSRILPLVVRQHAIRRLRIALCLKSTSWFYLSFLRTRVLFLPRGVSFLRWVDGLWQGTIELFWGYVIHIVYWYVLVWSASFLWILLIFDEINVIVCVLVLVDVVFLDYQILWAIVSPELVSRCAISWLPQGLGSFWSCEGSMAGMGVMRIMRLTAPAGWQLCRIRQSRIPWFRPRLKISGALWQIEQWVLSYDVPLQGIFTHLRFDGWKWNRRLLLHRGWWLSSSFIPWAHSLLLSPDRPLAPWLTPRSTTILSTLLLLQILQVLDYLVHLFLALLIFLHLLNVILRWTHFIYLLLWTLESLI